MKKNNGWIAIPIIFIISLISIVMADIPTWYIIAFIIFWGYILIYLAYYLYNHR